MVSVGDAQNGKRKTDDMGNAKNFPFTKKFCKFYGGKTAAGLLSIVIGVQLVVTALDFWFEPKQKSNEQRRSDHHR